MQVVLLTQALDYSAMVWRGQAGHNSLSLPVAKLSPCDDAVMCSLYKLFS